MCSWSYFVSSCMLVMAVGAIAASCLFLPVPFLVVPSCSYQRRFNDELRENTHCLASSLLTLMPGVTELTIPPPCSAPLPALPASLQRRAACCQDHGPQGRVGLRAFHPLHGDRAVTQAQRHGGSALHHPRAQAKEGTVLWRAVRG